MKTRSVPLLVASCLLGGVVGFVVITGPWLLKYQYPGSLTELVRSSVEHFSLLSFLLLFLSGLFFGLVFERPYSLSSSVSQVATLPVFAFTEIVKDPTSHNLWPIEFIQYAFLALVPLTGMELGLKIKTYFQSRRATRDDLPSKQGWPSE